MDERKDEQNIGEEQQEQEAVGTELFDWAKALATAVVIIVLIFTFFFRIVGVEGTSMVPTLNEGDRLVIRCVGYEPQAGDIVVLTKRQFADESIVKRVIATEGQEVDIDFATGEVRVDGVPLDEPYILEPTHHQGSLTYPYTVEEGCIFVMGDNRNGSTDSRWASIASVDRRMVIGGLVLRVWPFGAFGAVS